MEQVLDLYEQPYAADYPVVCLDEFPKQLIEQPVFTTSQVQHGDGQHEVLVVVVDGNWLAVKGELKTGARWQAVTSSANGTAPTEALRKAIFIRN